MTARKPEGTADENTPEDTPEDWVDRYGDDLYRLAVYAVGDAALAEDLVQETLLGALRANDSFRGKSSRRTWLIAILKHKIVDHYRSLPRQRRTESLDTVGSFEDANFDESGRWSSRPASWRSNPSKAYEQKEFLRVFYRCVSELPERLAKIFRMREMEEKETEEICKAMQITPTNCWVMLYRARTRMRECVEARWLTPGG